MTEKLKDGIVYIMFLKGEQNQPDNKYIGVTTKSLQERLKTHKKESKNKNRGRKKQFNLQNYER